MIACALSIAGSDPSGGAGIQADLKTFLDHRIYGMAAITALTTQNTRGVWGVHPVDPELVAEQVRQVLDDMPVGVIKIGMVGRSAAILRTILSDVEAPIVLDPVLVSSSGQPLTESSELDELRDLARMCTVITPNTPELEVLLKGSDPQEWAQDNAVAVLHTGGHGPGDEIVDVLHMPDGRCLHTRHARIEGRAMHGTGCTLSSAIASGLARGWPLDRAVDAAIYSTAELLRRSQTQPLGSGSAPLLHGLVTCED